jgi:hypothetical protein
VLSNKDLINNVCIVKAERKTILCESGLKNHQITTSNIRIIKTSQYLKRVVGIFLPKLCVAIKEQELMLAKSITLIPPVFPSNRSHLYRERFHPRRAPNTPFPKE